MPLIVPPESTATRDTLMAFMQGLQESRIRREERKRAEEAADAGSAGLGSLIGTAAGIALALPTGGASLVAALPAMAAAGSIGGALGGGIGSLVDPPGAAVPGGQSAQLAQSANQLVQGIGALGAAKTAQQKPEADLLKTVGLTVANINELMQDARFKGQPRSEVVKTVVDNRRAKLLDQKIQAAGAQAKAEAEGRFTGTQEEKKKDAIAQNREAWEWTPVQRRTLEQLDNQIEQNRATTSAMASKSPPDQEGIAAFRAEGAALRQRREALFLEATKKPRTIKTYAEQVQSGQPFDPFMPYSVGVNAAGESVGAYVWTERGNSQFIPGAKADGSPVLYEIEGQPGKWKKNDKGEDVPVSMPDFEGGQVGIGMPIEHPTEGSGRWALEEEGGSVYADFVPYDQKDDDSVISSMAKTLLKQSSASVDSVLLDMLAPRKGETEFDARTRTANMLASGAGAIMDAQQKVDDMIRVAAFVERYRGASGFQSIYLNLLKEDSVWAEQDALYQKLIAQPDSSQWDEQHKAIVRGLAKRLLGRLQRIQPEVDAMNLVVRKEHLNLLAELRRMTTLGVPVISPLDFNIGGRRFKATLDTE